MWPTRQTPKAYRHIPEGRYALRGVPPIGRYTHWGKSPCGSVVVSAYCIRTYDNTIMHRNSLWHKDLWRRVGGTTSGVSGLQTVAETMQIFSSVLSPS